MGRQRNKSCGDGEKQHENMEREKQNYVESWSEIRAFCDVWALHWLGPRTIFFLYRQWSEWKKCRCKREETYSYERIYDLVKFSNFEPLNGSHDDTIARRSMVPSSFAHQWLNHLALGLFLFVYVAFFNTDYTLCVVINSHCHWPDERTKVRRFFFS